MRNYLILLALVASCGTKTAAQDTTPANTQDGAASADTAQQDGGGVATSCDSPLQGPQPPAWSSDPKKQVRNLHQTWQRDASTTVTLTWTTEANDPAAYVPRVLYAPVSSACADGKLLMTQGQVAQGSGYVYEAVGLDGAVKVVAWTVELTGLQPNTAYVFRAGTWKGRDVASGQLDAPELGAMGQFRTSLPKGDRTPYRVVFAGDSRGGTDKIRKEAARYAKIDALAWFFNGDMTPVGSQEQWNDWFDAMAPILTTRPLMPVQGNHEIFADIYYAQFALPAMPSLKADQVEHAWSLDIGNVHYVGLDSNSPEGVQDQVAWLTEDLAAAAKDPGIDWTICLMHHAPWSASNHGNTDYVQKTWGPVFDQHGVDLVFAGHDHNYERSVPILGGKAAPVGQGVTYVVAGGFFAPPYGNGKEWWTAVSHHGNKYNYVVLDIAGKKLNLTAWSGDGQEKLDELALERP
jgi:hypothetical protein